MRSAKNDLQNKIQSQDTTGDQVPVETRWRSHSIAIFRHGLEKDNRIATHYCRTHRFDAPVPMHKVPQHMQNTIALQHGINKQEKRSPGTLSSSARAFRSRFRGKAATPKTIAHASLLFCATDFPSTRKNPMFRANPNIQIASEM